LADSTWSSDVAEPFRPATAKGALSRTLRSRRATTFEAIVGLLATSASVRDVGRDAIDELCQRFDVDLENRFASDRRHLYRRYLAHCLEDKALSEQENADLEHLKALLHLAPGDVAAIHDEIAAEVYGKAVDDVLEDLTISSDEDAFLRRLSGELRLSDWIAGDLLATRRQRARDLAMQEASSLDPEFTIHRAAAGEFVGRSETSFDDAVTNALSRGRLAVPGLHWFEVSNISGYVGEAGPRGWHVTVRAGIKTG
jgi:flavin-binding protein dodecin